MLYLEGSVRFEMDLGQNTHVLKLVKMRKIQKKEKIHKNQKKGVNPYVWDNPPCLYTLELDSCVVHTRYVW